MIIEFPFLYDKSDLFKDIKNKDLIIDKIIRHIKSIYESEIDKVYQFNFPDDQIHDLRSSLSFIKEFNNILMFNLKDDNFLTYDAKNITYDYLRQSEINIYENQNNLYDKFQTFKENFIYRTTDYIVAINKDKRRI